MILPNWVISDTHFLHKRIPEFEPVRKAWGEDSLMMTAYMIQEWNKRVLPGDTVLHLGDFCFGTKEQIVTVRKALHGHIILVLGNHDRRPKPMAALGFEVFERFEFELGAYGKIICRHDPHTFTTEDIKAGNLLLHGHLHSGGHRADTSQEITDKAFCCSVEALNSPGPVRLRYVLEQADLMGKVVRLNE